MYINCFYLREEKWFDSTQQMKGGLRRGRIYIHSLSSALSLLPCCSMRIYVVCAYTIRVRIGEVNLPCLANEHQLHLPHLTLSWLSWCLHVLPRFAEIFPGSGHAERIAGIRHTWRCQQLAMGCFKEHTVASVFVLHKARWTCSPFGCGDNSMQ
jgi:hypothetical protein